MFWIFLLTYAVFLASSFSSFSLWVFSVLGAMTGSGQRTGFWKQDIKEEAGTAGKGNELLKQGSERKGVGGFT